MSHGRVLPVEPPYATDLIFSCPRNDAFSSGVLYFPCPIFEVVSMY